MFLCFFLLLLLFLLPFFFLSCHRQRRGCQFATLIRYVHSGLTHQVPGGGCGDSDVGSGSRSGTDCPAAKCQASGQTPCYLYDVNLLCYTLGHILPYMQENAMHLSVALSVSNILSRQEAPFRGWLLSTHPSLYIVVRPFNVHPFTPAVGSYYGIC